MHPRIVKFTSEQFYDGKLLSGISGGDRRLPDSQFDWRGSPVVFVDVPDRQESFSHRDGSKSNPEQAKVCKDIIERLRHAPKSSSDKYPVEEVQKVSIAVLTPYTAQVKLLRSLGKHSESPIVSSVTVSTVDSFQGREADIVIFCTVRCNVYCSIGFLADERRINVSLTRAKSGLIVVGNKQTLVSSKDGGALWKAWFRGLNN